MNSLSEEERSIVSVARENQTTVEAANREEKTTVIAGRIENPENWGGKAEENEECRVQEIHKWSKVPIIETEAALLIEIK